MRGLKSKQRAAQALAIDATPTNNIKRGHTKKPVISAISIWGPQLPRSKFPATERLQQRLILQADLGSGRSDPFASLPIKSDSGTLALLDHCMIIFPQG